MLMRISLDPTPPQPPDRRTARAFLATNLLVLPGAGTLMAGRKVGILQAAFALAGVALPLPWLAEWIVHWIQTREVLIEISPLFWMALAGVALFAVAWFWSLKSGLSILREASRVPPSSHPLPSAKN